MISIKKTVLSIKGKTGRNYFSFILCFLFLNTYFLILNTKSLRAQTLSLSLWPPLLEVMIQSGKSVTQVYKLANNSDRELQITPQIYPFKPSGEAGQIKIKFPASPASGPTSRPSSPSSTFFSFDSGEHLGQPFYLPIGHTKEMVLKISIPRGTPEADHYYTLLFSTTGVSDEKMHSASSSVTQIGTNILLTVSPTGKPPLLARILAFSSPKAVDSFSAVSFTVRLENWGKTLWKPFGKIKITGILKQKEEVALLEQNILAESSRQLTLALYRPKLPFGPFKATLEFTLNENGPQLSAETVFWYLPFKLAGSILLLAVILLIMRKIRRKFKHI